MAGKNNQVAIAIVAVLAAGMAAANLGTPAHAQSLIDNMRAKMNFAGRKAVVINNAANSLSLSAFTFQNDPANPSDRFHQSLAWTNTGDKPIIAFEVVTVFYDPFNRQELGPGGRWMVTGHNSANWAPLNPGEKDNDGLLGFSKETAFTGLVYVRSIRFADDTIWNYDSADVGRQIRAALPQLRDVGDIDPAPKAKG